MKHLLNLFFKEIKGLSPWSIPCDCTVHCYPVIRKASCKGTQGTQLREARGTLHILYRKPGEGLQNFPKEMVKRDLNTGLPEPIPQGFPITMHFFFFLTRVPALNMSPCYGYVYHNYAIVRAIGQALTQFRGNIEGERTRLCI